MQLFVQAALVLLPSGVASTDQCNQQNVDDVTSFMQTKMRLSVRQPYGVAPFHLQAPAEGGPFSDFYNKRTVGHGIHKWLQYFPAYARHFSQFIGKEVHIMEIGVQSGGSLDMWKEVFGPGAHVYGGDINAKCKLYEDNQTKIFIGDQGPEYWAQVKKEVPRIDILIDDGGHMPDQQTGTLGMMLENLSPNGIYMTEDVHGVDNPFWQALKLNQLDSNMFHFKDLGKLVSSVHVYPFLLVIEKRGNQGTEAITRQLGIRSQADVPTVTRTAIAGGSQSAKSNCVELDLKDVFPSVSFKDAPKIQNDEISKMVYNMPSKSWLFVRDGDSALSLDSAWDDKTDEFMHKTMREFKSMHEGNCCNWNSNLMQQSVESLHFYPHLAIVKRTSDTPTLVKAVMHGTSWIPYVEPSPVELQRQAEQASLVQQRQASVQVAREAVNAAVKKGLAVAEKNLYENLKADQNGKPVEAAAIMKAFDDAVGKGTQVAMTDPSASPTLQAAGQEFATLLQKAAEPNADPQVKQQAAEILIKLGIHA
jgi:hypothetical protein